MLAPMPLSPEGKRFARRLAVVGALAFAKSFFETLGRKAAEALWPEEEDESDDEDGGDDGGEQG